MQLLLHDVVVVMPQGIGRQLVALLILLCRGFVVECHAYDAPHALHEQLGVEALLQMVLHILHGGMMPLAQPLPEFLRHLLPDGLCLGDPTSIKAETQCLGFDL